MTKPLDFPIPYPSQHPNDDLASARLLLKIVQFYMDGGENLSSSEVQCLFNVLRAAADKLDVIQLFLDDCEYPDMREQYQAARRAWTMQSARKEVAA